MQLACETLDTWAAIRELEKALPITALTRIIEMRERQHKPVRTLRRRLELLRAEQIKSEAP